MTKKKTFISWSGGKDSALALYELQQYEEYQPAGLITTVNLDYDRISIHGIRRSLLAKQAEALKLPLHEIPIPKDATNDIYISIMEKALKTFREKGLRAVMFGDLFLEDIRTYREEMMARVSLEGVFPLWSKNTTDLAHHMIDLGFKATIAVVDTQVLDEDFAGWEYDYDFLSALPKNIDPCGENGEFHTFVYDGPIFNQAIKFSKGEVVLRENRFSFCDFIPAP
jgi:uncharacterized protein (TIGR00290 family)